MLFDERVAASVVLMRVVALGLLIATASLTAHAAQPAPAPASGLTIVVIEGEDAVNVIQQKTAVAPIVEVRDRNNQPVSGATVRFAIQGGRATFNGAGTLTVTTDASGRATVTGLTPTGSGAVQISASAAFQGLTATVMIAQTNVLTAAQVASVAAASSSGGTGAAAGGAAAGAGGGISATTIAIVAGAVAGGAVAAQQVVGGDDVGGVSIYEGDFRIDSISTVQQAQPNGVIFLTCAQRHSQIGEVRAEIEEREDGTLIGTMSAKWNATELSTTCPFTSGANDLSLGQATVSGTKTGFQASSQNTSADGSFGAQSFSGALANGVITGTWTLGPGGYRGSNGFGGGSTPAGSVTVTLTK